MTAVSGRCVGVAGEPRDDGFEVRRPAQRAAYGAGQEAHRLDHRAGLFAFAIFATRLGVALEEAHQGGHRFAQHPLDGALEPGGVVSMRNAPRLPAPGRGSASAAASASSSLSWPSRPQDPRRVHQPPGYWSGVECGPRPGMCGRWSSIRASIERLESASGCASSHTPSLHSSRPCDARPWRWRLPSSAGIPSSPLEPGRLARARQEFAAGVCGAVRG